jgi:hypothetical protein
MSKKPSGVKKDWNQKEYEELQRKKQQWLKKDF